MSQSRQLALSLAEAFEGLKAHPNVPLSLGWPRLLQVPEQSPDLYLALAVMFGRMMDLRQRVQDSSQSERGKALYTSGINHLAKFVNPENLATGTNAAWQSANEINLLHLLADALPVDTVPDVQPTTLEALCGELEELLKSVEALKTEPEIAELVRSSLSTLLFLLKNYKAFGPDGAARIYGSVAAELSRRLNQDPPRTPEGKTVLKRALAITKKIGAVVIWTSAVAGGIDNLVTDASDLTHLITGPDHAEHAPKK